VVTAHPGLSEADQTAILEGNARRLLRLPEVAVRPSV
jgi:hypothetical protein